MTSAAEAAAISIDVMIDSPLWTAEPAAEDVVRQAIGAAARLASSPEAEIAIVLTDDSAIQTLNRTWCDRDEPTNVLSFPARRGRAAEPHLGDIVIAFQTVAREAAAERKPFTHHLAHLAVHGCLHLLGYNHDSDCRAEAMEQFEARILRRLGIPDPYASHGA